MSDPTEVGHLPGPAGENVELPKHWLGEPTIVVCTAWQGAGHMLWNHGMRSYRGSQRPWGIGPWEYLDSKALHPCTDVTGQAIVSHEGGWTALGIEDQGGDSRPGSHSTFVTEGTHDFDVMLHACRRFFPEIIGRIEQVAPIVLVEGLTHVWRKGECTRCWVRREHASGICRPRDDVSQTGRQP